MPHDQNGTRLSVGQLVVIRARIKEIHDTEEYCNVTLETENEMPPTGSKTVIVLNAKQVELAIGVPLLDRTL